MFRMTRKGWCPRKGKGQRFMGKVEDNGNISSKGRVRKNGIFHKGGGGLPIWALFP